MLDIIYVDNIKIFQVFIPFNLTNSEISQTNRKQITCTSNLLVSTRKIN